MVAYIPTYLQRRWWVKLDTWIATILCKNSLRLRCKTKNSETNYTKFKVHLQSLIKNYYLCSKKRFTQKQSTIITVEMHNRTSMTWLMRSRIKKLSLRDLRVGFKISIIIWLWRILNNSDCKDNSMFYKIESKICKIKIKP